jgi:hypothetical protein
MADVVRTRMFAVAAVHGEVFVEVRPASTALVVAVARASGFAPPP